MNPKKFFNKKLREEYFFLTHESGLKIYVFPKRGYSTSCAIIGVKYGSINQTYETFSGRKVHTPSGVAHYLEHKLFESEECDAFSLYAKFGASANAFTSFDKTAYYFSCSEKFKDSLKILLDFTQSPYFTPESVEKEREIITQEINMYYDSPRNRVTNNLLKCLYKNHPVKNEIAGTVDSISEITHEILYDSYNNFYNPNNMSLCLVGDFEVEEMFSFIDKNIKKSEFKPALTIFPEEPESVFNPRVSEKMEVASGFFNFGFKEKLEGEFLSMKDVIINDISLCALTLKSGRLYNRLIDRNLINVSSFFSEHFNGPYFSSIIFEGNSEYPEEVASIIREEAENMTRNGIEKEVFERAKKNVYAESISMLDGVKAISNILLEFSFLGYEIFEFIDKISKIKLDELNEKIKNKFRGDFSALSVIEPLD
ncbi:MAG: insulinase family protein [Oscillospiraceae bacterium]|jgi:predicted Zn-dependent peptidase|nr:insulinase family protein [Oscillospiraceae bacterium]